jgi:gamma-glutamyltranspeptidase
MIMSNKQIMDFYETDLKDYEARGVKPLTCVQTAGDIMIVPESWGHGVLNLQESVAIATEYKHSLWRIKPPPTIVSQITSQFDNRMDKSPLIPPH